MNITTYVKRHYDKLPKSSFNDQELVVVMELQNEDYGYGNQPHGHNNTLKKFEVDGQAFDLTSIKGSELNFDAIQVEFSDY